MQSFRMPSCTAEGLSPDNLKLACKTTRRGLAAAVPVFVAMVAAHKAMAMALPPTKERRSPSCFLRGTRILTPKGEVKVEDLTVGDLVTTIDGTAKAIQWIGSWTLPNTAAERWPGEMLPIKVSRSALDQSIPHTDLFLSPFHSVYIDGLLVPVRNLVNGRSIVHCGALASDTIEYFHVELIRHDVIFSEGAPTETLFVDASCDEVRSLPDRRCAVPTKNVHQLEPFAPRLPVNRSAVIRSRLRSAMSPWVDRREPGDLIWERLAERAETQIAA
jgi:Hint domain